MFARENPLVSFAIGCACNREFVFLMLNNSSRIEFPKEELVESNNCWTRKIYYIWDVLLHWNFDINSNAWHHGICCRTHNVTSINLNDMI